MNNKYTFKLLIYRDHLKVDKEAKIDFTVILVLIFLAIQLNNSSSNDDRGDLRNKRINKRMKE